MERLQKRLARAGVASRRAAEELIREGRVTVGGVPATLGQSVGEGDEVRVDGVLLSPDVSEHVTFMLYKPRGIITSARDELGRQGVLDLMPTYPGLHSVGRLDRDSEGLLLLTTDGDLTLRLTHPRYAHEKQYRVWLDSPLPRGALDLLRQGVELDEGRTSPAEVEEADGGLYVTIREGRNRQVRRMVQAVGAEVTRLVRVRFGGLFLGDLRTGEFCALSTSDLQQLEDPSRMPRSSWREAWQETRERWG
ncbi:pseudouridine synthase [Deinococcus peraridilitoris]|uniref:Pseudouridine synthase n=1 Tax=Deinococcus peraridilitoris (strain DSM 19664 / LMG 22246 / CIP 109416 / KR-200) TaxID=937777 RepID=L0A6F3_DEIPD|nr:pseudouridine synthase [Deinococcus peraridilitoris]AFZ68752.1 pseudouridine synthase family protein [Deinococcus peraridilitoris DSM 19664]